MFVLLRVCVFVRLFVFSVCSFDWLTFCMFDWVCVSLCVCGCRFVCVICHLCDCVFGGRSVGVFVFLRVRLVRFGCFCVCLYDRPFVCFRPFVPQLS